jgi:hypothetical protein
MDFVSLILVLLSLGISLFILYLFLEYVKDEKDEKDEKVRRRPWMGWRNYYGHRRYPLRHGYRNIRRHRRV